mgnify:CR=1 FL=1
MIYTEIKGTGSYVPKKVLTNDDLKQFVDTSDEWIASRTGIKRRHIVVDELTVDLAYEASLKAIESSKINKEDIVEIKAFANPPKGLYEIIEVLAIIVTKDKKIF